MFIYPRSYKKLRRGPQVILPKDIGMIIAFAEVDRNSVCVDAGTGSGWLACSLAKICKQVYSYDTRREFLDIAEENREALGLGNLALKNGDVFKKIDEREVDVVTLDMLDSDKALRNAKKALKTGGRVVGYMPNMEQVKKFVLALERLKFTDIYATETIVRDFLVRKEGTRPTTKGIWHTAYLVFAKKE